MFELRALDRAEVFKRTLSDCRVYPKSSGELFGAEIQHFEVRRTGAQRTADSCAHTRDLLHSDTLTLLMADPIPTSEAAARKGCTRQAIINAIQRGEVNGWKLGPVWAVVDDDRLAAWNVKETGGRVHRDRDQSS